MDEVLSALFTWICSLGDAWYMAAMLAGALCAALATVVPAPKDDAGMLWKALYSCMNIIGMNFGRAKNKEQSSEKKA